MSEQRDSVNKEEILAQIDEAGSTRSLLDLTEKILNFNQEYAQKSKEAKDAGKKWVGIKVGKIDILTRREDFVDDSGKVMRSVLRIDKKYPDETVETVQFLDEAGSEDFSGLSYIKGVEKAEMVYPEEGTYRSSYSESPLEGLNAVPKAKELIKSLI